MILKLFLIALSAGVLAAFILVLFLIYAINSIANEFEEFDERF